MRLPSGDLAPVAHNSSRCRWVALTAAGMSTTQSGPRAWFPLKSSDANNTTADTILHVPLAQHTYTQANCHTSHPTHLVSAGSAAAVRLLQLRVSSCSAGQWPTSEGCMATRPTSATPQPWRLRDTSCE